MIPADHPEAICVDCSGPNVCWYAPNDLWNQTVRPNDGDPMLCPRCFIIRAEARGLGSVWKITADRPLKYQE